MLFCDFHYNLRKLNSRLCIDVNQQTTQGGFEDFPTAGLYLQDFNGNMKYLFGVPHQTVPEYSIAAIDFSTMERWGQYSAINEIKTSHLAVDKEKLLWRGWRATINNLIRMGHVEQPKAEKIFNTYFEPNRLQLPRTYIDRSF